MNKVIFIVFLFAFSSVRLNAQQINFSGAADFNVVNRNIVFSKSEGRTLLLMDAAEGVGVAWIKNTIFSTGTVEFDAKGKDVMQQSFIGIAFHGMNDTTYDCIYFRPFNFNANDTTRQNHSVQYISMPQYDWQYLRTHFPGLYEHSLNVAVAADGWFHVKIIVGEDKISVYVNSNANACLTVKPLHGYKKGSIGFWVGNNSDGTFSNLVIKTK
jgi:hypothetical protein